MISTTELTVRYAETDKMGIVYHTNYGIWYEIARTNFIKELGFSYLDMEKDGMFLPVIDLKLHYISPARYDDDIKIKTSVSSISSAKIEFSYSAYIKGGDNPINTGTSVHAFVNDKMKLINLKKTFPEIYTALENSIEKTRLQK